jgi:putative flippase GtrA
MMRKLLLLLASEFPPMAPERGSETRMQMLSQFARFGTVGAIGFVFDTATVYALRYPLGLYGAGLAAYFVAVTVTWGLNRTWTFRGQGRGPAYRQWAKFVLANFVGFLLNRGTYAILVTISAVCAAQPVLAVAAGSLAGMFTNFGLSRRLVFR